MNTDSIKLGVNIDHVATVRQARGTRYPDLVDAARAAEAGGADSITIHLREDRRHIQDADVFELKERIETHMNLELAATSEMVSIACRARPRACCIVPERRAELTTEGGLDALALYDHLAPMCAALAEADIEVSLFLDPDPAQIACAVRLGVPTIELHTGQYALEEAASGRERELEVLRRATAEATGAGLRVNAGHGLHYENVRPIAAIEAVNELNIGHAIVARALFSGLETAVRDMKALMLESRT
ncbi:MAG: pyridoxine 5'-phosphate synthase [Gammaproteobacteria bacterium]